MIPASWRRAVVTSALDDEPRHCAHHQPDTVIELVLEVRFGYASDGAYVRLWADGTEYVNVAGMNVGYPDLETTAGYWKFCAYAWGCAAMAASLPSSDSTA